MSSISTRTQHTGIRPAWSGLAVVVEALFLLAFLVGSLTILTQLFAAASVHAREGEQLAEAVAYATNAAEHFAADPSHAEGVTQEDDLTISCTVRAEQTARGTLYRAIIRVTTHDTQREVYTLSTARYEREVE